MAQGLSILNQLRVQGETLWNKLDIFFVQRFGPGFLGSLIRWVPGALALFLVLRWLLTRGPLAVRVQAGQKDRAVDVLSRGELYSKAAEMLEQLGRKEDASLLHAKHYREEGQVLDALERFKRSGQFLDAAELVAAMGAPTLAVFTGTDPRVWKPLNPRVRALDARAFKGDTTALVPRALSEAHVSAVPPPEAFQSLPRSG